MQAMEDFRQTLKLLDPSGEKFAEAIKILDRVPEFQSQLERVATTPDEFNKFYSDRGWIAYESMESKVIDSAVFLAREAKIEEGEKILIAYYHPEKLKLKLNFVRGVPEFQPRMRLIELAMEDYFQNRYHACIPVLLMMIDGVVNDVTKDFGLFAENVDVTAWDSIAAHESGLRQLSKLLSKTKNKTNLSEIEIPFRNGILHGRELAYDNKVVAVKTWALLFAVRDWILARRKPKATEKKEMTIQGSLDELRKIRETNELLDKWTPRRYIIGTHVPQKGKAEDYEGNSPEQASIRFISYWLKKNYGKMSEMIVRYKSLGLTDKKLAGELREACDEIDLVDYELINIYDAAPAVTEVKAKIKLMVKNKIEIKDVIFRWIYMNEEAANITRGIPGGQWYVIDNFSLEISLLKV